MALIQSLKEERIALKKKVKIAVKRLQLNLQHSNLRGSNAEATEKLFYDLETTYSDFLVAQEDYVNLIDANPDYKEEYAVVNGLDLKQYSDEIEGLYDHVMQAYNTHKIAESELSDIKKVNLSSCLWKALLNVGATNCESR